LRADLQQEVDASDCTAEKPEVTSVTLTAALWPRIGTLMRQQFLVHLTCPVTGHRLQHAPR
jgi:hypothetical protein